MDKTGRQGVSQKFMSLVQVMLILKLMQDTKFIPSRNIHKFMYEFWGPSWTLGAKYKFGSH